MHRFFASGSSITDSAVRLEGDDVKHITKVLRLGIGDRISVCDGEGTDYICAVSETGKDFVEADIIEKMPNTNESNIQITLYQGLPKGDKMDYIIQKSVELGVNTIVPVAMKRTVVKLKNASPKEQRWQRIAEEAAKQSMRGIIPSVESAVSFDDMVGAFREDTLYILPYENESHTRLKHVLADNRKYTKIGIIIGPEGGFEEDEVAKASQSGAHAVTLGPRILRCETAPVAAVAAVMYELGDW